MEIYMSHICYKLNFPRQTWSESYDLLKAYANEHKDARVLYTHITENGYNLGGWTSRQRKAHRKNELSHEHINKLEALPKWTWEVFDDKWLCFYRLLKIYIQENRTAYVPKRYVTKNGHKLGNWGVFQRTLYRQGRLSQERIDKLEALPGWVWEVKSKKELNNVD